MARTAPSPVSLVAAVKVTDNDREEARSIEQKLRKSRRFGEGPTALLDGDPHWSRFFPQKIDKSESGRDFHLALTSSHYLRDHPRRREVMYAMLERHSRKAKRHLTPSTYILSVVDAAASERQRRDDDRVHRYGTCLSTPMPEDAAGGEPGDVLDVAHMPDLLLRLVTPPIPDCLDRHEDWTRVPVGDLARLLGCHRTTVYRNLKRLAKRGQIEYDPDRAKPDGMFRCDTWIRLVRPMGKQVA
jgi:hypothetical protein